MKLARIETRIHRCSWCEESLVRYIFSLLSSHPSLILSGFFTVPSRYCASPLLPPYTNHLIIFFHDVIVIPLFWPRTYKKRKKSTNCWKTLAQPTFFSTRCSLSSPFHLNILLFSIRSTLLYFIINLFYEIYLAMRLHSLENFKFSCDVLKKKLHVNFYNYIEEYTYKIPRKHVLVCLSQPKSLHDKPLMDMKII